MPYTDQGLPFDGSTPLSKHASWTGAMSAADGRKAKTARYIHALIAAGRLTDQHAQLCTGLPLSSINSIRNALGPCVVAVGHESVERDGQRRTLRTQWAWKGAAAE